MSCSGIRSPRRINLSFVRLRLLSPDSAAGAFLFFGVFTLALWCYQHPCQVPTVGIKFERIATFIAKPEAFTQRIISLIPKRLLPMDRISSVIIRPSGLRFTPITLTFRHVSEIAGESRARNTKQSRCASLVLICLIVNESHMPLHRALE